MQCTARCHNGIKQLGRALSFMLAQVSLRYSLTSSQSCGVLLLSQGIAFPVNNDYDHVLNEWRMYIDL